MSYLRFEDQADGVHVFFDGATPAGGFMEKDIATLNRASAHSIRFRSTSSAATSTAFSDGKKLISDIDLQTDSLPGARPAGASDQQDAVPRGWQCSNRHQW